MASRISRFLPRSRRGRWLLGVLAALLLFWLLAPRLVAPYVQRKLQAMIASKVDAELRMGSLTYLPPFGVRVRDARLIAHDRTHGGQELEVFKVAKLDLRLAKLPFRKGPLVIERVEIRDPELRLVFTDEGLLGKVTFARPRESPPPPPPPPPSSGEPPPPPSKLSDMFELRHLELSGGKIVVEDRRRSGSVPMVWSDLSLNTQTSQTSKSGYRFEVKGEHTGVASLDARGAFDLDEPRLTAEQFALSVATDPKQLTSGLPAQVQDVLRRFQVAGKVSVGGHADVPLNDWHAATFDVRLEAGEASAKLAAPNGTLDHLVSVVRCRSVQPDKNRRPTGAELVVERFEARGGPSRLALKGAPVLTFDRSRDEWSLKELDLGVDFGDGSVPTPLQLAGRVDLKANASGPITKPATQTRFAAAQYHATVRPTAFRVQPPKWTAALENVGNAGTQIDVHPGIVVVKNLSGRYGTDEMFLRSARMPLPARLGDLKDSIAVEEITGRANFTRPGAPYPGAFGKVIASLQPAGLFEIGGGSFWRINRVPPADDGTPPAKPRKSDWFFGISTDGGSLTLAKAANLVLDNIHGDATVSPMLIDVTRLECALLGGTGTATGKVLPRKPFTIENGRVAIREVDLAQLARMLRPENPSERLVGRGFLNATFAGSTLKEAQLKPDVALTGGGEFQIIQGDFWTLPVLGDIATATGKNGGRRGNGGTTSGPASALGTVGEAAGTFRFERGNVVLESAAVSSPALGLIGSGTVGFAEPKTLDLRVVAAPLGDWRERIRDTRIPILSNVVGEVVGGLQRLVNTATSTLLYEFRVSGTLKQPKVETVPAPVLTEPAAMLFGRMLDERRKQPLIEAVRPGKK
jgi:hypothetical protein